MKSKILILVLIGLIVLGFFYFQNRGYEIVNAPVRGEKIMAFGDSLVYGTGGDKGGFVSILSKEINRPIINAGVPGNTTRDGLRRLEEDVLSEDPDLVIILLGGNDYLKRVPKDETFSNLAKIVSAIQSKGAVALLLGVRGGLLKDNYDRDFKKFAKNSGVAFVPNVLENILGNKDLMSDAIHPNDKGYLVIADKIKPILSSVLK